MFKLIILIEFFVSCRTARCSEVLFVSHFGQEAVVGLENLGKGWLGIQGDAGRGRLRGKMENVTDSQFEMEFI